MLKKSNGAKILVACNAGSNSGSSSKNSRGVNSLTSAEDTDASKLPSVRKP